MLKLFFKSEKFSVLKINGSDVCCNLISLDISFSKHVPFYSETGELMASVDFDNNQNLPEISMLNWYKKHMEFHLNKNKEKDLVV